MNNVRLHQPDINGTHAPVGQPLSPATQQVLRDWMTAGNLFAPNTSYTIAKIHNNIQALANAPYITELGVAVHEPDAETLLSYHALSTDERSEIARIVRRDGPEHIQTAAFFPRFERGDSHGMFVYVNRQLDAAEFDVVMARYFAVEHVTKDAAIFAKWLETLSKEIGLVEWKPMGEDCPNLFGHLHTSSDSGGTFFVTPQGVDKASTFLELCALRYPDISREQISIAGDSPPTDGPLFYIPGIVHIAVKDRSLLQDVPGENLYVETPEDATDMLRRMMAGD